MLTSKHCLIKDLGLISDSGNILYTLAAEDPDDLTTSFRYEIISTNPDNLPPDIKPANGIDYMAVNNITGDVTFHTPIDFEVRGFYIASVLKLFFEEAHQNCKSKWGYSSLHCVHVPGHRNT